MKAPGINHQRLSIYFQQLFKSQSALEAQKALLQKTTEVKLFINLSCAQSYILFKSVMCDMSCGMETCHCFAQAVHVICLLVLMSFHFSAMCQKETVYKATLQTKKKRKTGRVGGGDKR